jgi:serine phosphatase RsbU (regulator of sigma subunit)
MRFGVAARPVSGEQASGDAWAMKPVGSSLFLMLADGLGHGIFAAEASAQACVSFLHSTAAEPAKMLDDVHHALRGTRGAAVSIAEIDFDKSRILFAGLGNVAGVIIRNSAQALPRLQVMVSQNGTAGHEARHFKEFEYQFGNDDILVMHSDGLSSHWNLLETPGLLRKQPSVIAGTLYRDYMRDRDDVCVVVGKKQ